VRVGLWTRKPGDQLEFRDIVGWVTVISREQRPEATPENAFHAVMLDDTMYPIIARIYPRYCGVFPKKTSEEEAKALALEWAKPKAEHAQPNVTGVGLA